MGPDGKVFGFDRDPIVRQTAEVLPDGVGIAGNYADIPEYLRQMEIDSIDAILDLGLRVINLRTETGGSVLKATVFWISVLIKLRVSPLGV